MPTEWRKIYGCKMSSALLLPIEVITIKKSPFWRPFYKSSSVIILIPFLFKGAAVTPFPLINCPEKLPS